VLVVTALMIALQALGGGCRAHAGRVHAPPALGGAGVRGQRVLVVAGEQAAETLGEAVARHLSTLPIRVSRPADFGEDGAVEDWRLWAWERRIPYLLMLDTAEDEAGAAAATLRLVGARGPDEVARWEASGTTPRSLPVDLRAALRTDLGVEERRADGQPTTWPVCAAGEVQRLRDVVLLSDDPLAEVQAAARACPVDPALIELEAVARLRGGERAEALRLLRRAQAINPEGGSELEVVARMAGWYALADIELTLWQAAVELWPARPDHALELAQRHQDREDPAAASRVLFNSLERSPEPVDFDAAALADREDAAVGLADAASSADRRYLLGWALYLQQRHEDALVSYSSARKLYEALEERDGVSACRNNLGVTLVESGRAVAAIPHLRAALLARGGEVDSEEAANTAYNLGAAYEAVGRLTDADLAWRDAAARYGAAGSFDDQFETMLDVVLNQGEIGARDEVEALHVELQELAADDDPEGRLRARALDAVGVARARVDRVDESLAALDEALVVWIELEDRLREGQTRYNMAIPHLARGDVDAALRALAGAREIAVELRDSESIVAIDAQMKQIERMR
jgi:tetratricopeptide (TPR) repeat protein